MIMELSERYLPKIRGEYRFNVDLSKTTWFRVGGPADVLFRPEDEEDLAFFLSNCPKEVPLIVLGVGSNILIRDKGFRGIVIKLGKNFVNINSDQDLIKCGAGALDYNVAHYALKNQIGGLEFLVGIPGTIGGALRMNAGAYGNETANVLVSAKAIDVNGNILTLENKDFGFKYRGSSLDNSIIFTEATLKGFKDSEMNIQSKMDQITQSRESSQPVRSRTGGSTFKNPPSYKAWELIDKVGLRGYSIGGAQFSELHCNFLINKGNATSQDIEDLGELARKKVFDEFGINLEWEIKIIGER